VSTLRRLPFNGPEGKPAFIPSNSEGPISLLADALEAEQLEIGETILALVLPMLEVELTADEARYMLRRVTECLTDALRVAESRGQRLGLPDPPGQSGSTCGATAPAPTDPSSAAEAAKFNEPCQLTPGHGGDHRSVSTAWVNEEPGGARTRPGGLGLG
jgi:hypothetical protein